MMDEKSKDAYYTTNALKIRRGGAFMLFRKYKICKKTHTTPMH